jgi:hypothetical protein
MRVESDMIHLEFARYSLEGIMNGAKGVSGNTVADLREVAVVWDKSAKYCDECGETELAERDRRFAAAMREAANILSMEPLKT